MDKALILHSSSEGQTTKIAEYIAEILERNGISATTASIAEAPQLEGYDSVAVGASIHVGRYAQDLIDYLKQHAALLDATPNAFFAVSLTAGQDDEESRTTVAGYLQLLVDETGWQPNESASFAGALRFSKYGFFKRQLMKVIARRGGLSADASRDHELTDWTAVESFASKLAVRFAVEPVMQTT